MLTMQPTPISEMHSHHSLPPSAWVERFAPRIPAGGRVLDLACGRGRHARLLATLGYRVDAVDRDAEVLEALTGVAGITPLRVDLEDGPWPFPGPCFDGIVVTNYLYRPRLGELINALLPGGILIYETFMVGHEQFGKPSNPEFLLRFGELLDVVNGRLCIVAFEQGRVETPRPAMTQRLCAVKAAA